MQGHRRDVGRARIDTAARAPVRRRPHQRPHRSDAKQLHVRREAAVLLVPGRGQHRASRPPPTRSCPVLSDTVASSSRARTRPRSTPTCTTSSAARRTTYSRTRARRRPPPDTGPPSAGTSASPLFPRPLTRCDADPAPGQARPASPSARPSTRAAPRRSRATIKRATRGARTAAS